MIRTGLKIFIQVNLGYKDISEVSTCNNLMKELVKKNTPISFSISFSLMETHWK
jgi:hypothetical protein